MPCRLTTALRLIEERLRYKVIVIEPQPGLNAMAALECVLTADPKTPVIVFDECGSSDHAKLYQDRGAAAYVHDRSMVRKAVETVMEASGSADTSRCDFPGLIGDSEAMQRVREIICIVGPRKSSVLIQGETGTGKEVVAKAIHMMSGRENKPLVCVNCAAIPETLIESELFGHTKGAFTGAIASRPGKFEEANGGTIFLDEIGELPLNMQAKLLRVLQEREVQRLGSSEIVKLDVRIIAATNADLDEAVEEGRFREDLLYRINVVPVLLPALRDRLADIPSLVQHFIAKICSDEGLPRKTVTADTLDALAEYSWPGNIRQLEHAVELAVVMSGTRAVLRPDDFALAPRKPQAVSTDRIVELPDGSFDYEGTINRIERSLLSQALAKAGGNKARAAHMLGLKRTTFSAKVRALALEEHEQWEVAAAC